jgi:integrase
VIQQQWATNLRNRLLRVCKLARIRDHKPKDFRDTYASTLVTHGIVLKWISLQLGHASIAVTERHYAAYMAMDGYRNPWMVPEGCLPPDLFVSLDRFAGTKRAPMTPSH